MLNFNTKMTVKVTKGQIAVPLYQKINVTRSTISWENFHTCIKKYTQSPSFGPMLFDYSTSDVNIDNFLK